MQPAQSTSSLDFLVPDGGSSSGQRVRIESAIRDAISDGRLPPGSPLPSTRALARDLAVARSTVVDAYAQLSAEGWITGSRGSGTRVADGGEHVLATPPATRDAVTPRFDFTPGRPDAASFPRTAWVGALRRALRDAPDAVFDYGDPRGLIELREQVAGYLGRVRGARVHPDHVIICNGFVEGLAAITGTLHATGAAAAIGVEQPCLAHHRSIAVAAGLRAIALPVDADGARVEGLDGTDARAVLLTPAHQQPMGTSLSAARRGWVVEWARRAGGLVIEDDYDSEFRFDRAPLGALQGRAPDVVAYLGTVSKTLAPGLRLGWLVVPAGFVGAVLEQRTMNGTQRGVLDQLALAEMIRSGAYDRHVRRMRLRYRDRRDLLLRSIATDAPAVSVTGIAAGLQAMVRLPEGGPTYADVIAVAAARGVALHSVNDHHWHGNITPERSLVVGYGTPPEHAYRAAVGALMQVFAEVGLGPEKRARNAAEL